MAKTTYTLKNKLLHNSLTLIRRKPLLIILFLILTITTYILRSKLLAQRRYTRNVELSILQNHASHVLFWDEDTPKERHQHTTQISNSKLVQKNYATLQNLAKRKYPKWSSFLEWSVSSAAYVQLYYLEVFKQTSLTYTNPPLPRIVDFDHVLFPWLRVSVKELYDSFGERGIVITTGNDHFQYAYLLIKSLREVLNCTLPIELVYGKEADLSRSKREIISQFENVRCVDLSTRADIESLKGVYGWWYKSYAVLLSRFNEVIFIDADVIMMVDPIVLFEHENYIKFKHLLYTDRRISFGNNMDYKKLKQNFMQPSPNIITTGIWNESTTHQAESGILLYDKRDPMMFLSLLSTCNLNSEPMLSHVNEFFYGDKETFWIAFELLHVPYKFVEGYGATIGFHAGNNTICGPLTHSDKDGKLIWFNGGLAVNKDKNRDEVYDFQYYTLDDIHDKPGKWTWERDDLGPCFTPPVDSNEKVKTLSEEEKKMLNSFITIYKAVRKDYTISNHDLFK